MAAPKEESTVISSAQVQRSGADSDRSREIRLITFTVGRDLFVLDIMAIRQIVPYTGSTPVPKAPDFIEGIIILRNEVIPVIDLRQRLFPQLPPPEQQPLVLILRMETGTIGVKVDEVRRIVTVDGDSILPPSPILKGLEKELVIGVIQHGDDVLLLLDVEALLTAEEKDSLDQVDLQSLAEEASTREEDDSAT